MEPLSSVKTMKKKHTCEYDWLSLKGTDIRLGPKYTTRCKKNHYAPTSSRPEKQIVSPTILYQIKAREKLHLGV